MRLSMTARLTLTISLLILVLMGAASLMVSSGFKKQLMENQTTGQTLLLNEISVSFEEKLSAAHNQLISLGTMVTADHITSAELARRFLDFRLRPALHKVFDNHVFLFTPEGRIITESPFVPDRKGLDFSFRPYIKNTVATASPYISDPYISSQAHKHPVIMMTVPIFDSKGKLIAILAGSMDLLRPNILGNLAEKKIGKNGYFYLITRERFLIMHPDKTRIFTRVEEGQNLLFDRALHGFEGTDDTITSSGEPVVSSFKRLKLKEWFLVATIPQAELYEPLNSIMRPLLGGILLLTMAAFVTTIFFSKYLTGSLSAFTRHVESLYTKTGEARFFPVKGTDEIAALSTAFNSMLAKLDHQQLEIKQDEELMRTLIDSMPDIVCFKDCQGHWLMANAFALSVFGLEGLQYQGKSSTELAALSPVGHDALLGCELSDELARKSGKLRRSEETMTRPDGSYLIFDVIKVPLIAVGDERKGMIVVGRDITERKRAEAEKDKLEAQLQQAQKMESVGRLAGGVAHDFNNMLGVITGHTEMAFSKVAFDHPVHVHLVEIGKAAHRSADLTRQLLTFSRRQTIAPVVLDMNKEISGMLRMLQRVIGEDIDLEWKPAEEAWPVLMDATQLDQIIVNLCVNSRDAIHDVGKITIETANTTFDEEYCSCHLGFRVGDYVRLAVSDNGCGMDKETLSHIFEPFFTTKEPGKGTGLGLATVYGAIRQNNGFINVYSEPGQGTTITLYLPRHAKQVEAPTVVLPAEPATGGGETILLVEDETAILDMTTTMLQGLGYNVLPAFSPAEALRLAAEYEGPIHLLITDVVMPGMNGRDLANELLTHLPHLKRLFMSGYTANVIAHHGVLDAGVCFIQKPFSRDALAALVRQVLAS